MSKNGILIELKGIAYDLVDNNGNFRTIPIGTIGTRNLPNDRIKLLQYLVSLVKDTDIICNETKLYVFNRYITIRNVNEALNEIAESKGGKQYSYNTTQSKIAYDRDKLHKLFGDGMISDIAFRTNNDEKMKEYTEKIINAHIKYNKNITTDLRDNLALDISKEHLCSELDDTRFDDFLMTISPYLKSHMQSISSMLDTDSIGYFNYLLYSPILTDVDKKRLDILKLKLDPNYTVDIE